MGRRALSAVAKAHKKNSKLSRADLLAIAVEAARLTASMPAISTSGHAPFQRDLDTKVRVRLRNKMLAKNGPATLRDLPTLPGVQSLSIATRYLEGGRDRFIEFVQLAHLNAQPAATKWFIVYADLLPSERVRASFDDICAASGVKPSELMAVVTAAAMEMGVDVGNLVAAVTHPQVVAAGARAAIHPAGIEDRRMMFQHQGFIPIQKGAQINIHASANAQAAAAVKSSNPELPTFESDLTAIQQRSETDQPARQLAPASPSAADELAAAPTDGIDIREVEYDEIEA